jgi:serine/threonine-protein kinase RsbT
MSEAKLEIHNENDIVTARKRGRDIAGEIGFKAVDCAKIATAISELARNIFLYTRGGVILIRVVSDNGTKSGIEIIASDTGPGIEDIDLVMRDGYTTSNGLGLGLPGTKRLMDEFELKSEPGTGTTVRVGKWLAR